MIPINEMKHILAQSDMASLIAYVETFQPYDLANCVERLEPTEQLELLGLLPPDRSASILEYLEPVLQYRILNELEEAQTSLVLNEMSSDVVVDMMLALHRHQADRLLELLPEIYRRKLQTLMTFPEHTAGSLATIDYIAARSTWTIERTLQHIRKIGHEAEITSYVYVTGNKGELVGVVSLKNIILAEPKTEISEIVTGDVISVPASMEQEEAAELLFRYDLVALPVIDAKKRLIGVITVDDLIDVMQEEATEDIQKLGGSQPLTDTYFKSSVFHLYRKRIIWLLILFVAETYTGTVLRHYEETLSEVIALSFFIPLLIGTGGNTGTQTVSTLVRALAVGEVKFSDIFRVIRKEVSTGLMTGATISLIAYIRALILGVESNIGLVVGITAMAIVIWASFVAAVLPLILHKLKADPAVISGPFITTLVDGTGLIIYFTIAKVLLHL
ncbi:magnesium transporter [Paenibacillus radicis (ex Xue et al. 2023)]|uniref:Magnesium transporter MgtE n=1 Tax=Paenibacillus radicis (ex Xue et al. 2023) TaxID=2972489 RepID=A0ABT1YMI4_9BACL|nr:magnesium transporter [Paenibacillus radicis (ex Xue et al. 2023)]MCR8634390.1 magnesium transporter [Paenibacillus radicis (ex Xue et al. 2023)]